MRIVFLTLDEAYAVDIGPRVISALLKNNGHSVDMLFNIVYSPGLSSFSTQTFNPAADNFRNINQSANAVAGFVKESGIGILAISVSTNHFERAARITAKVKETRPDIFVVWGGVHPTVRPEECLNYADCICMGEGEESMLELANRFSSKGRSDIYDIPGLWFNDKGAIIKNAIGRRIIDIDSLPFQDYDLSGHYLVKGDIGIKPLDDALMPKVMPPFVTKVSPSYAISATRGCPYSCGYCINSFINRLYDGQPCRNSVRRRSVDSIVQELGGVKKKFPFIDSVFFIDDLFICGDENHRWLEDFSRQYQEKVALPFMCLMHFSQVNDRSMELLVSAGLKQVSVGIESGSENTLKNLYNRYLMPDAIVNKARIINKYKDFVIPSYDVILDNPYETDVDLRKTMELILRLPKPFHLGFYSLTLFPGVPLSEKARNDGLLTDELIQVYRKHYNDVNKSIHFNQLFLLFAHVPRYLIVYLSRHHDALHRFITSLLYRFWNFCVYCAQNRLYQQLKGLRLRKQHLKRLNLVP